MRYFSPLRHTALLVLFGLLLLVGILQDNVFDDVENSRAGEMRELRDEAHSVWTLLSTSRARWQTAPLTLSRHEFPHVTDAFAAEYIKRNSSPQLRDVHDARTLTSRDFFEQIQMLRRPGSDAAQMLKLVDALTENERVAARAAAARNRRRKLWKTRRPATSLFSYLMGRGRGDGGSSNTDDDAAFGDVVEVLYPSSLPLHHRGSPASPSLASNDVQLVPYPWVPLQSTARHSGEVAAKTHTSEYANTKNGTEPAVRVSIAKGRLRSAVPHRPTPHTPTYGWDHFYIALNLWKNEEVLPDLTEALIVFLEEEVKPFFDLSTSVVVSIYATISPDRTAELILTLLIPRLHAAGVRRVYATTEGSCLGYVERQPFHERIEWMACIRNKALAPLYNEGMNVFERPQRQKRDDADAGEDSLVVLFFNDILFRPQDITKLLESRAEPEMAATTRPHGWLSSVSKTSHKEADASPASATDDGHSQRPQVNTAPASPSGATSAMTATTFDMACGMDFYFTFYDTWVTRDRLGKCFEAQMPYSADHATQDAFYRILRGKRSGDRAWEAAAIPVKCCWNGVAAIRGRFFLAPRRPHRLGFPEPVAAGGAQSGASDDAAAAEAPQVVQHPSGAVYDRIGDVRELLNKTALSRYYTRVLARRLKAECALWSKTRREIAALTDVPFYEPEACDNSSSFKSLLQAVVSHEMRQPSAASEDWTQLRLSIQNRTLLLTAAPDLARHVDAADKAEDRGNVGPATPVTLRMAEDSVYYRARHPSLRFRHAFTPSYGAAVNGQAQVRDEVCPASECLLICQDVMHAALLQDRRAPIILLNPQVRVAYSVEHFNRVISHTWFFENPYVYWGWTLARRLQLWWPLSSFSMYGNSTDMSELRERGDATSAIDDWLQPASVAALSEPAVSAVQEVRVQDGDGRVKATGLVDITILTRMDCERVLKGSMKAAVGSLFPFLRLGQLLFAAMLLLWLSRQVKADVFAAPAVGGSAARARSVEVQWWRALYHALRHFTLAQRLGWRAGGVASEELERAAAVSRGGHSRVIHFLPHLSTLLQVYRLKSHHFTKTWAAYSCGGTVRRATCVVAQALMRLLSTLCCVRLWHGYRPRRRPFTSSPRWLSYTLRQLWPHRSSASPAKLCYRWAPFSVVEAKDAYGTGPAVAEEVGEYTAVRSNEGMARSVPLSMSIPRSVTASGGNYAEVQWRHHDASVAATEVTDSAPASAAENPTELHHQVRSRGCNYVSRSPLQLGGFP
ncbi:hypothetical protein LSCM4_07934 [Leishmania orientalis]|uniref:Uncharacterized protein n=1 Tax=Leishmania orientalis TaxID=2249476 RepID=A0A836HDW8_9TRYP|nr:hypothetical protein LSCM4_07934 [Leishmania orientalis]